MRRDTAWSAAAATRSWSTANSIGMEELQYTRVRRVALTSFRRTLSRDGVSGGWRRGR
jgi:hypothetical protein